MKIRTKYKIPFLSFAFTLKASLNVKRFVSNLERVDRDRKIFFHNQAAGWFVLFSGTIKTVFGLYSKWKNNSKIQKQRVGFHLKPFVLPKAGEWRKMTHNKRSSRVSFIFSNSPHTHKKYQSPFNNNLDKLKDNNILSLFQDIFR